MSSPVELVAVPEHAIACLPVHGSVRHMSEPFARLSAALSEAGLTPVGPPMARLTPVGPPMARLDAGLTDLDDTDYEVCLAIRPDAEGRVPDAIGEARSDFVPAHYALVTTHTGPHAGMSASYAALMHELDAVGYAAAGPATEVYLVGRESGVDAAAYVTEIRLPIAR